MAGSSAANNNMYRVGDYVYVDAGPNEPFGVRRIDELQKSAATGNVEAEVMIYYRRIDLPAEVIAVADENLADGYWDEMAKKYPTQVHERELFLAKKTETISATQIRGKCAVSLLHKVSGICPVFRIGIMGDALRSRSVGRIRIPEVIKSEL